MRYLMMASVLLCCAWSPAAAQTSPTAEGRDPSAAAEVKTLTKELARLDKQIEQEYADVMYAQLSARSPSGEASRFASLAEDQYAMSRTRRLVVPKNVADYSPRLKVLTQERAALEARLAAAKAR